MHLVATLPWPHLAGEGRLWLEGRAVNGKLAGLLSWLPRTHNEVSLTKISFDIMGDITVATSTSFKQTACITLKQLQ